MEPGTTTRALFIGILVLGMQAAQATVASGEASDPVAALDAASPPRVRSQSARVGAAIARGTAHSPTFRRLVETINATDGLVFVDEGVCARGVRACLLMSVSIAGPSRLLRILVNLRKAPGCETIEMIGHELQHAIEVLENPRVRTDRQVYNLFDVIGRTSSGRFETRAALRAGLTIAEEGCGAP